MMLFFNFLQLKLQGISQNPNRFAHVIMSEKSYKKMTKNPFIIMSENVVPQNGKETPL